MTPGQLGFDPAPDPKPNTTMRLLQAPLMLPPSPCIHLLVLRLHSVEGERAGGQQRPRGGRRALSVPQQHMDVQHLLVGAAVGTQGTPSCCSALINPRHFQHCSSGAQSVTFWPCRCQPPTHNPCLNAAMLRVCQPIWQARSTQAIHCSTNLDQDVNGGAEVLQIGRLLHSSRLWTEPVDCSHQRFVEGVRRSGGQHLQCAESDSACMLSMTNAMQRAPDEVNCRPQSISPDAHPPRRRAPRAHLLQLQQAGGAVMHAQGLHQHIQGRLLRLLPLLRLLLWLLEEGKAGGPSGRSGRRIGQRPLQLHAEDGERLLRGVAVGLGQPVQPPCRTKHLIFT